MGADATFVRQRDFQLAKSVTDRVFQKDDGWNRIDFANEVMAPIHACRDEATQAKYQKVNQYSQRSIVDEMQVTTENFFEGLGIAPRAPNSTNAVFNKQKES